MGGKGTVDASLPAFGPEHLGVSAGMSSVVGVGDIQWANSVPDWAAGLSRTRTDIAEAIAASDGLQDHARNLLDAFTTGHFGRESR